MYAGIHVDDIRTKSPSEWDALKVKGSYLFWVFVDLNEVTPDVKYFEIDEYSALGWKFYNLTRDYITVYEDSNVFEQIPFDKWVKHPKKSKGTGKPVLKPMRYKYILTPDDVKQGIAFGQKMETHVQRALKSQARREKLRRIRRIFSRV